MVDETKPIESTEETEEKSLHYVPYGVTSFDELDELEAVSEKSEMVSELTYNYNELVWNILTSADDPLANLKGLNEDYLARLGAIINSASVKAKDIKKFEQAIKPKGVIERVFKSLIKSDDVLIGNELLIIKSADGTNRWVARYSNNRRDNDNPPEIISSKSHENFVRLVDAGLAPLPKLLVWHEKSLELGQSEWVAYDDVGFPLAGGYFYPGTEEIVETIKSLKNVAMSHGMPRWSLGRDEFDSSVITAHITEEISLLPKFAAANKRTGFIVLDEDRKEIDMITDEKKRELESWGIKPELINALEAQNAKSAAQADLEQVDKKEVAEGEVTEPVAAEVESTEGEVAEEGVAENQQPQLVADPEILAELGKSVEAALAGIIAISDRVKSLEVSLKELQKSDVEKVKAQAASTPLASLRELAQLSVIGSSDTKVDGRTTLAKSGPEEAEPEVEPYTPIPFVNALIDNSKRRALEGKNGYR